MLRFPRAGLALGILAALGSASCGEQDTQFNVKSAPGWKGDHASVSVFGVFRSGRMSPETWSELGPKISAALGKPSCEVAYGEKLSRAKPDLFAAVDDDTRSNGVTEDLLDKLSSMAEGEIILTFSLHDHGKRQVLVSEGVDPNRSGAGMMRQPSRGGGGGSGMRGGGRRSGTGRPVLEDGGFELAATLFSVRDHRALARISMDYAGQSADEGVRRFVEKLGSLIPGSTCQGWKFGDPAAAPRPADPATPPPAAP